MKAMPSTVYLVGAGPGDPDLISVRGHSLLREADVVLHDRLIPMALLDAARPDAEVIDVGKAPGKHRFAQQWINALLVGRAQEGKSVVRLKGGDPFVFGRGHEELAACREGGVDCVVVPGVSSAFAGPAAAGIPVTHRGLVRSVAVITARFAEDDGAYPIDYDALAQMDTIVVLMGRARLREMAALLIGAGKDAALPAACVEQATTPQQRTVRGTLADIAERADLARIANPCVIVFGEVAAFADAGEGSELWPLVHELAAVPRAV